MSEMVLGGLVDASVRVVLVATLVAAAFTVFRVQAVTTRHAAWTVVLVAMLLMPALSGLVPRVGVPLPAIARGVLMPTAAQTSGLQTQERNPRPLTPAPVAATRRTAAASISLEPVHPEPSREEKRPWAAVALGVYLAGVVVMLLRFALGLRGARRLTLGRLVDTSTHRRLRAVPVTVRESGRDGGPFREITGLDPDGPFVAHARAQLAESSDPVLLTAAAEHLLHAPRYRASFSEDHVLARDCLERAASLGPQSVRTRTMLAAVVSGERRHAGWERVRDVAPVDQYDALAALPAVERFEAMAQAAVDSLFSVRGAAQTNDRNMARYIEVKADNARRLALGVLDLAPSLQDVSDSGLFVYQAHMTLASLAMLGGDTAAATESLGDAALVPAAEGLAYGRRVAAWAVLLELADAGKQAAVVDFLEAMADKSVVDRDLLLTAAEDVRNGQRPARLFERV